MCEMLWIQFFHNILHYLLRGQGYLLKWTLFEMLWIQFFHKGDKLFANV